VARFDTPHSSSDGGALLIRRWTAGWAGPSAWPGAGGCAGVEQNRARGAWDGAPEAAYRRHTYASLLIPDGVNLTYIRDRLGRPSIKLTVDTYRHLVPGTDRAALDRLDDATGRDVCVTEEPERGEQDDRDHHASIRKAGARLLPPGL